MQHNEAWKSVMSQMRMEIMEYKAESYRMANVLSSVGVDVNEKNCKIDPQLVVALTAAADALGVVDIDTINLSLAAEDLYAELKNITDALQASQSRIELYSKQLPKFVEQKCNTVKECTRLEAEEEQFSQDLNKLSKSTLFHSKKKAQYSSTIKSTKEMLKDLGYKDELSHENLSAVGAEVQSMEERLKTMRLTLKSYHDLPPNIRDAQIVLEEKNAVLATLENELAEKLGNVAVTNALGY